jgi:hypothetical protein
MSDYSRYFTKVRLLTTDLKKPEIYMHYYNMGFRWIRKYHASHLNNVLRYPTVGCWIELFYEPDLDCVHIESRKGYKLINKLCYF